MSNSSKIKISRYESTIKKILTNTIHIEIYDPLIKLATIVDVRLTNDKSIAKIYISCYDKNIIDKILSKINGASGYFRTILAKELNWRKAPQVIFVKDNTQEKFDEVQNIINSWKEKSNG
ncbi:30S ribosome-binding factor RbfA [Malacoplasma muris]|uniref:30S ribosome-binding factor RbfA n=1 Tax=Malacoplasma muris TaxID=2119 RepID=UPI00398E429D